MAQHGGKRPGAGRKPGAVSRAKRELADMAKDYAELALQTLVDVAGSPKASESARVSAAVAILDRGYGKPFQAVQLSGDANAPVQVVQYTIVDPPKRE